MHRPGKLLLPFILLMIIVPFCVLLVGSGYYLSEMPNAAENLAQSIAEEVAGKLPERMQQTRPISGSENAPAMPFSPEEWLKRRREVLLGSGLPVHGWLAIVAPDGELKKSVGGAAQAIQTDPHILEDVKKALSEGTLRKRTIVIGKNPPSALATVPYHDEEFGECAAVVSVSHYLLPPDTTVMFMSRYSKYYVWATLAVLGIALWGVYLLMKYCILPLKRLSERIKALRWGEDVFSVDTALSLPEIDEVERAFSDLSERAVDREKLKRNYARAAYKVREDEWDNLADNIHDYPLQTVISVIQQANLVEMYANELKNGADGAALTKLFKALDFMKSSTQTAVKDLRYVCNRLSPAWLKCGAEEAFDQIAGELADKYGIVVDAVSEIGDAAPTRSHLRAMYSIATRAVEYAVSRGAEYVYIKLSAETGQYILTIQDDGSGMGPEPIETEPALLHDSGQDGLADMIECVDSMNGAFSMVNAEDCGVLITASMPAELEDVPIRAEPWRLGQGKNIQELAAYLSNVHHVGVSAEIVGDDGVIDKKVLNVLCDIVRQSVSNAAHRGNAKNVRVKLVVGMDAYTMTVLDDGIGLKADFDPVRLEAEGHRGVSGMKRQAASVGGTFSIANDESGGTRVTVVIPRG